MTEGYSYAFERLEVWKKGKELVKLVYQFTRSFPREEQHGLTRQMRRAGVSVISNLAEGTARQTPKDRANFSVMAYSSLMELVNQVILSHDLGFLENKKYLEFRTLSNEVSRMINALQKAQKNMK